MPEFYHRPGGRGTPPREVSNAYPLTVKAQPLDPVSANGSLDAAGEYVYLTLPSGASGVIAQVTGVFVGTLTFEASADLGVYVAVSAHSTTTSSTTTTTTGLFGLAPLGRAVRVRMSAYTSGAAFVTLFAQVGGGTVAQASSGSNYTEGDIDTTITGSALMFETVVASSTLGVVSSTNPLPVVPPNLSPTLDIVRTLRSYTTGGWCTDGGTPLSITRTFIGTAGIFTGDGTAKAFLAAQANKTLVIWWVGDYGGHASGITFADTAGTPVVQQVMTGTVVRQNLHQAPGDFPIFVLGLGLGLTCNANAATTIQGQLFYAAV